MRTDIPNQKIRASKMRIKNIYKPRKKNIKPETENSFHSICSGDTSVWEECEHTLEQADQAATNAMLEMLGMDSEYYYQINRLPKLVLIV